MGMWKLDAFSNDDALDFIGVLGMLSDGKKLSVIKDALTTGADKDTYLELPDACAAIAASALVAIQLSPSLVPEDPTIEEILRKLPNITSLQEPARGAMERSIDSHKNEWYELVAEQNGIDEAFDNIEPYLKALST